MQMTDQTSGVFIFGIGYSAQAFAARAVAQGWSVGGTVRAPDKAAALREDGIAAEAWGGKGSVDVPDGRDWLITIPPDEEGCPVARAIGRLSGKARSVTYLSTTGVYGDLGGGWAFEWSPLMPGGLRAVRRERAETQWMQATDGKARLVRLPGIYGPARSAFDRLAAGTARRIEKEGQVFSRIHVDDIASGLEALVRRPGASGVFHFCDDMPAPPQDIISHAASVAGIAAPPLEPFEDAEMSEMARSFYADCKRVSNARTKAALGWRPRYADYRSGLCAIFAEMGGDLAAGQQ